MKSHRFVILVWTLALVFASPALAAKKKTISLALASAANPNEASEKEKKQKDPAFSAGGAEDLLNSKAVQEKSEDDAAREGSMKVRLESQRLQNSLPYFNGDGKYNTGPIALP